MSQNTPPYPSWSHPPAAGAPAPVTSEPAPNRTVHTGLILVYVYLLLITVTTVLDIFSALTISPTLTISSTSQSYVDSSNSSMNNINTAGTGLEIAGYTVWGAIQIGPGIFFAIMYRKGQTWARLTLGILAIVLACKAAFNVFIVTILGVLLQFLIPKGTGEFFSHPLVILSAVLLVVELILLVAIIVFMFKKDAARYTTEHGTWRTYRHGILQ